MQPHQPAVQLPPSLANQPSLDSLVKAIQADWYEAVRILQMAPDLAKQNDAYGSSPLHFAAMHRANVEVSGKWRNDRSLFCLDTLIHKPIYIYRCLRLSRCYCGSIQEPQNLPTRANTYHSIMLPAMGQRRKWSRSSGVPIKKLHSGPTVSDSLL